MELAAAGSPRLRTVVATIDLFAAWGIATFVGALGQKGTLTKGWPEMPLADAAKRARAEAANALGMVNLAARSGRTGRGDCLAVIDLDGVDGYDPEAELQAIMDRLPEGVGVVRTRRGFTIWYRLPTRRGNGVIREFSGPQVTVEMFTDPHLVQLPPSLHPCGLHLYDWYLPPGGELPTKT